MGASGQCHRSAGLQPGAFRQNPARNGGSKTGAPPTAPLKIVRRMVVSECLTRFVFRGMQQLVHTDGLTFDFLHGLARSLQESKSMALIGAGPKGAGPLVLRDGGTPFRAFLYGEVEGSGEQARYRLLLLLSDQELKRPAVSA